MISEFIGGFASLVGLRIMSSSGSCSWKLSFVSFFVYCTCIISNATGKFLLEIVAIEYMQFNRCVEKFNFVVCSHSLSTAITITEGPVSVTALVAWYWCWYW